MTNLPPVSIKVNVDASGVASGVSVVSNELNGLASKTKAATAGFGQFKQMALGVFGGNILTQGVMGIQRVFADLKQEAMDTQVAMQRLATSLDNMTGVTEANKKAVQETADAYSNLGFEGSDATFAMGTLVTATGDVEQATKLMAMSADLARYKHISMADAAKILARGTQGSAKAFKELGISLDTSLPKNKAIAQAFDDLNSKIGGQAVQYTHTFSGALAVMQEKFQQVFDVVAGKIMPVLAKFFEYITKNGTALLIYGGIILAVVVAYKTYAITTMLVTKVQQAYIYWTYMQTASTNVFKFAMYGLNAAIKANPIGFFITLIIALGMAFVWAWNKFEGFRKGVIKGLQIVINAFGYLVGAVATALKALGKVPGFGWAKSAGEKVDKLADGVRRYSDSLDKLANKKMGGPSIAGFVAPGGSTGITGNVPGGDAAGKDGKGGSGSTTVQYVTVYASNTNDIYNKLSKSAKHGQPIGVTR